MNRCLSMIYPELKSFGAMERENALRAARAEPFDVLELAGIAVILIVVTALTRYGLSDLGFASRAAAAALNFAVALPLLAVGIAPFLVRRVRRGLREQLERRGKTAG